MNQFINFFIAVLFIFINIQVEAQSALSVSDYNSLPKKIGVLRVDVPKLRIDNAVYIFTKEDALWIARLVQGEAGIDNNADGHAVIWTMLNRFGLLRHKRAKWSSFTKFLRLYSTPLQPYFYSPGAANRAIKRHGKDPAKIKYLGGNITKRGVTFPKVQTVRHLKIQQRKWGNIPLKIRKMVIGIMSGEIQNPGIGMATEFAGMHIYYRQKYGKEKAKNMTYKQWKAYTLNYAKNRCQKDNKGCIWIGYKKNLNQTRKNAFFIDKRFSTISTEAIKVGPLD